MAQRRMRSGYTRIDPHFFEVNIAESVKINFVLPSIMKNINKYRFLVVPFSPSCRISALTQSESPYCLLSSGQCDLFLLKFTADGMGI
jgi:hypothetical protein